MNNKQLDDRLTELRQVAGTIEQLQTKEQELRKEVFGIVENEGLTEGYKNNIATVSYVERKSVKIEDEDAVLAELQKQKLAKYFKEVPPVPAHLELTPEFIKDVKEGKFEAPGVTVDTATNLAVRFSKN